MLGNTGAQIGHGLGNNGLGTMTLPSVPVMPPEEVTTLPQIPRCLHCSLYTAV
jgi:hypothetical protein